VHNKINLKPYAVPGLLLLMWAGLLWSRAILSLSMIAFFAYALFLHGREGLAEVRKSRWLQGLLLLFAIPLVSGLWSEDRKEWWAVVQVKLPLLFFPFCVAAFRGIPEKGWRLIWWGLTAMLMVSMAWSLAGYIRMDDADYLKARVMKVAMYDDHVRYAWLLVIVYSVLLYGLITGIWRNRMAAILSLAALALFIHLLAAKTGLLGFYVVNLIFALTLAPKKYQWPVLGGLLLLPLLAWLAMPSFRNRMKFVVWDFQNYSRGAYTEGLSDAPRVLSWKAAADLIEEHPIAGVGAGDVIPAVNGWYAAHAPFLKDYERLVPANQVLLYGCYAGLAGALLALLVFLLPFTMRGFRQHALWISFHVVAFLGFLYEIALEMQFGAFIYALFGVMLYANARDFFTLKR
jgi:O-antigen ligase